MEKQNKSSWLEMYEERSQSLLDPRISGKQEFRRTDFGSRLLAAEGEGCVWSEAISFW